MALGEGLTLWAVVALLGDLGHFITGWNPDARGFVDAQSFAYVATVVFWAISFAQRERKREPLSAEMEVRLHALHDRVQLDHRILASSDRPTPNAVEENYLHLPAIPEYRRQETSGAYIETR